MPTSARPIVGLAALLLAGCGTTSESIVGPAWGGARINVGGRMIYPQAAFANDVSGVVVVACKVGPDSRLVNCEALYESPPGHGFGSAAIAMQEQVIVPTTLSNGDKTLVTIPFCFDDRSCAMTAAEGQQARAEILRQRP